MSRILSPEGTPIAPRAEQAMEGGFTVSSDFSLQTGLGSVRLTVPSSALLAKLKPYLRHSDDCPGHDQAPPDAVCTCGLANLLDDTNLRLSMYPPEARALGVKLIVESEAAMLHTCVMRLALQGLEMPPGEAVRALVNLTALAYEAHAQAYKMATERQQQIDDAMEGPAHGSDTPS